MLIIEVHRQLWCHVTIHNHYYQLIEASNAVTDWHPHCAQSESLSSSRSSSSSLPNNSSDDDDDTPLEVNREAEVEITPCRRM